MTLITFLLFLCIGIIAIMSAYAARLWWQVYQQKQRAKFAQTERQEYFRYSVQTIAKAMQSGECNLSEGVLRLYHLLPQLALQLQDYPHLWQLYEVVKGMPTHDERRALDKKARRRLDRIRETNEAKLADAINTEVTALLAAVLEYGK